MEHRTSRVFETCKTETIGHGQELRMCLGTTQDIESPASMAGGIEGFQSYELQRLKLCRLWTWKADVC